VSSGQSSPVSAVWLATSVEMVALVTGAASGIGLATAELLLSAGHRVAACDLDYQRLESLFGGRRSVLPVRLDVRSQTEARDAVARCEEKFGGLDWVTTVAGVEVNRPVDVLAESDWDYVIDTNMKGTYLVCAAAVPALRRRGKGAIVTVGSVLGRASRPGITAYSASKAGIEALTRAMALDYAGDGIRVNAVLPGATDTPLMWSTQSGVDLDGIRREVEKSVPMRRMAEPGEIANAIAFLLSEHASFITGTALVVDGGQVAQYYTRLDM
jgi:NAD(P)-dependent dehydrogenase (short-subunit alcohol dehydrogenase family)